MVPFNWIKAIDLNSWAARRDTQALLPQLIRWLIHATIEDPLYVGIPAGESVQIGGWDGIVKVSEGNAWVPEGFSTWEFGTNNDPKKKADGDYDKRCKDSLGVIPGETTFVFVTPRRWVKKDEWVQQKNQEGIWAEVRVYDADDLEQWLEQAPAVHSWLARLLGKWSEGFQDLTNFWEEWINSTEPPMSTELHLAGREELVEKLKTWLDDSRASSLVVQGDSREEAIAFFGATIFQMSEVERTIYLARCLIIRNEQAWPQLITIDKNLILIPAFDKPSGLDNIVRRGHHVFLPIGNEIGTYSETLQLPRLAREGFEQALLDMRLPKVRVQKLVRESRRNLLILRRLLAKTPEVHEPNWAKPEVGSSLIPVLLAGAWNDENEEDRKVIEEIARKPYREILQALSRWAKESEPPVHNVGKIWQLISREDSWHLLSRFLTNDDINIFTQVALSVLETLDPRYDLSPNHRSFAAMYGRILPHSYWLRQGIAETLVFLATRGEGFRNGNVSSYQNHVNSIVYQLLKPEAGWKQWASLSDLLPVLAEAAPDSFLNAVDNALAGDEPFLLYGSPHIPLLWALETTAWEPMYLGQVTLILGKLTRLDPGGRLANRPFNSLCEIFACWCPQTPATLNQRLTVIDTLLKREPDVAWKLLLRLLPERSPGVVFRSTHRPHWREWGANWTPGVTNSEYWQTINQIADRLLLCVGDNRERWDNLIELFASFPQPYYDKITEQLEKIDIDTFNQETLLKIWEGLRKVIYNHRKFADADWALPKEVVDRLYLVYQKFKPKDLIEQHIWLFTKPILLDAVKLDWGKRDELLKKAREEAVLTIYREGNLTALLNLAKRINNPREIGSILGETEIALEIEDEILNVSQNNDDESIKALLIGFVWSKFQACGWQWVEKLIPEFIQKSVQQRVDFLRGLPFEKQTWDLAASLGQETDFLYWQQVNVYNNKFNKNDCEELVHKLLEVGRVFSSLNMVALFSVNKTDNHSPLSCQLLVEILERAIVKEEEIAEPISDFNSLQNDVEEIFQLIENSEEIEETRLAKLEWAYLPFLIDSTRQPQLLHRELSKDPFFFAKVLEAIYDSEQNDQDDSKEIAEQKANLVYRASELLESWKQLPGLDKNGIVDLETLRKWVMQARDACRSIGRGTIGDQKIGQILAYAPADLNGVWPDIAVREIIEETASKDIEQGVEIGIFNKRGVWIKSPREGGLQERKLAESYRHHATAIEDTWPRTAALLRRIADSYKDDADREDISAELEDY